MTTSKPLYISKEGLAKMKEELEHLKTVTRKELAERIAVAKELGDLRENADYQEGKEALAYTESRINELHNAIQHAQLIEDSGERDMVQIGVTVTVKTAEGKEKTYTITGAAEAEPLAGKISNESPIGLALIGKRVGDQVEFKAPAGVVTYTVTKIA